jgi:putative membrane protein
MTTDRPPPGNARADVKAADVLANERTFLAWIRTALALAGFGFVIAKFQLFEREFAVNTNVPAVAHPVSELLGAAMALLAIVTAAFGVFRYVKMAGALRSGELAPLNERAAVATGIVAAVIGAVIVVDLVVSR